MRCTSDRIYKHHYRADFLGHPITRYCHAAMEKGPMRSNPPENKSGLAAEGGSFRVDRGYITHLGSCIEFGAIEDQQHPPR